MVSVGANLLKLNLVTLCNLQENGAELLVQLPVENDPTVLGQTYYMADQNGYVIALVKIPPCLMDNAPPSLEASFGESRLERFNPRVVLAPRSE